MSGPIVLALRLLLAASLYGFLAWAFLSLWREIRQQGTLLAARSVPPVRLTIVQADGACRQAYFSQPVVTVGRNLACECPLDDQAVSGRHACLSYHHGQWWLEDLGSRNGTRLNEDKLSIPTVVMSGDQFSCGGTQITIELPPHASSSETGGERKTVPRPERGA
jgi:pSer/pThr/pTyr-binding forkhead associated (FHA) protein